MIEDEVKNIYESFCNKNRFEEVEINFNQKKWVVPDWASFVAQLKEIYLDEVYQFNPRGNSPVVFDCGSNVGVSINFFKMKYPGSRVIGFEADPRIFTYLKKNTKGLQNIEIHNCAVWSNDGKITFNCQGADAGSIVNHFDTECLVSTERLKNYIEKEEHIDLLKIDIEGAEIEVLKDCANSLDKVDNIFVEYHSVVGNKQELDVILQILTENGFRYYMEGLYKGEKRPLVAEKINFNMDLQLSIWARRMSGKEINTENQFFWENKLDIKQENFLKEMESILSRQCTELHDNLSVRNSELSEILLHPINEEKAKILELSEKVRTMNDNLQEKISSHLLKQCLLIQEFISQKNDDIVSQLDCISNKKDCEISKLNKKIIRLRRSRLMSVLITFFTTLILCLLCYFVYSVK